MILSKINLSLPVNELDSNQMLVLLWAHYYCTQLLIRLAIQFEHKLFDVQTPLQK